MFTYSNYDTHVLVTSTPIFENGAISHVVTLLDDITDSSKKSDLLEKEIRKNEIISKELDYYRTQYLPTKIIGSSPEIMKIRNYINFVSKTNATILITGESGVGKEVFANELYQNSLRSDHTAQFY